MRCLFVAVLISFVLVICASAIELFRYNLTTPDGRKFQYIFDVSDPASGSAGDALSREEIVNRAMGWMLSFHKGPDDGSIESVNFAKSPSLIGSLPSLIPLTAGSNTCFSQSSCLMDM